MTLATPSTDPAGPVDDAVWHRLSPRMLFVHPIIEVGRALPALVGIVLAGSGSHRGSWWGPAAAAVVALLSLSRWFTTRLRVTADQVQLRHGLLRRRTITTARDRIRTVDVTSHLIHRLLGLARVVVGTGINDRKGEGRIVLDGLTLAGANGLRDELLPTGDRAGGRRAGGHRAGDYRAGDDRAGGDRAGDDRAGDDRAGGDRLSTRAPEDAEQLAALDRRWIWFAPFTLSGVVTGFVVWGFYTRVQSESQVDLLRSGPLRAASRALGRLPTAAEVAVVGAALVLFVAVTSTAGYLLAFWNFRLVRHPGGTLQVTRGLVTTRATSIERGRLVGATVSEPLVLRAVGGARTLVIATGLRTGRGAERGGEVLLPPAPIAVARRVAALALDGTTALQAPLRPHGARARRRRLVRAALGGLLLLAAAVLGRLTGGSLWPVSVAAVLALLTVPLGIDRYRSLGHALSDGYLVVRAGSLLRRRSVLRTDAVIGWNLRSTYFQRRLGLTTLVATTAAGGQGYRVLDVDRASALALAAAVTPGLLEQFSCPAPTA